MYAVAKSEVQKKQKTILKENKMHLMMFKNGKLIISIVNTRNKLKL